MADIGHFLYGVGGAFRGGKGTKLNISSFYNYRNQAIINVHSAIYGSIVKNFLLLYND